MFYESRTLIGYEQRSFLEPLKRLVDEKRCTDSTSIASLQR